jgi:hypothetical protein
MTSKPPNSNNSGDKHPYRTYWLTAGASAIIVAIIVALVTLKPWSGTSSTAPTTPPVSPSPTPTAQAAFTSPQSDATNIPPACTLTATGTVEHLEPNHHLWLFLYFYDDKYYGGDSLVISRACKAGQRAVIKSLLLCAGVTVTQSAGRMFMHRARFKQTSGSAADRASPGLSRSP